MSDALLWLYLAALGIYAFVGTIQDMREERQKKNDSPSK